MGRSEFWDSDVSAVCAWSCRFDLCSDSGRSSPEDPEAVMLVYGSSWRTSARANGSPVVRACAIRSRTSLSVRGR